MIGILVEKPSAAKNFATALGGSTGTYNGEQYCITASHGHLYGLCDPAEQVSAEKADKYRSWSLETLPWNVDDFAWKKEPKGDASSTLKNIKNTLSSCDEIVIATDDDPTGEGELLAWEIIDGLNLAHVPISRMYFDDEAPKSIQKAFVSRKRLPPMRDDPDYRQAYFRERWDFLSMQFSRIATLTGDGITIIRQGRLKSAMVVLVGDQLKAIQQYKKIPYYENRFKDENGIVYSDPDTDRYEHKEDVPQNLSQSEVVCDKKVMKAASPRQLLDLASLASILAARGIPAQTTLDTYQKMYEDHIVSYPRTEDKKISPEQFNELLPLIDRIADVVSVDKSLLTHRTPRKTHIQTGMAHGANRPGTTVPVSLDALSSKYGQAAPMIYEILAKNYLAILAEDYKYEHQEGHIKDYPDYTGSVNIPKSMGWKLVFSDADDTDKDENNKGLGTIGIPFIYEGFPPKPSSPTMKWLMKQLEKRNVGTGATRASIFAQLTATGNKRVPLLNADSKGKITMTEYGDMSYILLPGTHIGDLSMTEHVHDEMKGVAEGTLNADDCLREVAGFITDDMQVMSANGKGIPKKERQPRELVECTWHGRNASFNRIWMGHRFDDEEVEDLINGEDIKFLVKNRDGDNVSVTGHLGVQEWKDKKGEVHKGFGFIYTDFINLNPAKERVSGVWNGREVSFRRIWGGYRFSDAEVSALLEGKKITFQRIGSNGQPYDVTGGLADQKYNGNPFVGFKKDELDRSGDPDYCTGLFKGRRQVTFKRVFGSYRFTDQECALLLSGAEIEIHDIPSSKGSTYSVKGKLKDYQFKGKKKFGFKAEFI